MKACGTGGWPKSVGLMIYLNNKYIYIHVINILIKQGSTAISILGIIGNVTCCYLFIRNKSFNRSSYAFYLKLLSLADSLCLIVELIKALNDICLFNKFNFYLYNNSSFNLRLVRFLAGSFQMNTTFLLCVFSIQRCISINSPLLLKKCFTFKKPRIICFVLFLLAMLLQINELFLSTPTCFKFNQTLNTQNSVSLDLYYYFNQSMFLVIIPSLIIILCNSIVWYKVLNRRRMITRGHFHKNFKINISNTNLPKIEISQCESSSKRSRKLKYDGSLTLNGSLTANNLNDIAKHDTDSINSSIIDDCPSISTIHDDTRSLDSRKLQQAKITRRNRKHIEKAKRNRDIKLFLLMIFSISFIVLVLPDTLLNIYKHYLMSLPGSANRLHLINRLYLLLNIFYLLKLVNYSSNFLVYFTLVTFSSNKKNHLIKS